MSLTFILIPYFIVIAFAFFNLSWRILVKSVLFLILIEGVLRKWVLPQASNLIYLSKDFILIIAYLKFFIFSSKKRTLIKNTSIYTIYTFLFLSSIWLFFQSFNPDLGSPIVGLFGLSRYLLYVPLMWMIPYLFNSQEELTKFLRTYLLCIIPVCLLGIVQFNSPASSIINFAPGGEEADANLGYGEDGKLIRISSTFSYNNLYVGYLVFNFSCLLPFLITQQKKSEFLENPLLEKVIIASKLLLLLANFFMTGSRSVVVYSGFILLGYLFIKSFYNITTIINFMRKLAIPSVLIAFIVPLWFTPALNAFLDRATNTSDVYGRFAYNLSPQTESGKSFEFIDGYGTGATHSGIQPIKRILSITNSSTPPPGEAEVHRIKIEIGTIGVIFWYGMRISILVSLWFVYQKLQTPFLKDLGLIAFLFHLQLLPGQVVFHPVNLVYYWFTSGFIFLLPRLEMKKHKNI